MKKLFFMLLIATLSLGFVSCGDDKDEPKVPEAQTLESDHENENDTYFVFDIDMKKDKSTIYMYNIQFAPRAPKMTLRVNVPVNLNSEGNTYIMSGTNLAAEMEMQSVGWIPMEDEQYRLNNLKCTVNPSAKQYSISFDAHGGHFEESGKLK
jgi:hypothetical protein